MHTTAPRLHQSCCINFIHLHFVARSLASFGLPPFFQPSFSTLAISRWYSHLKEENRARKNKHGDARTRGGENTKHRWVLNTKPSTDAGVHTHKHTHAHTHRGVYKHTLLSGTTARTHVHKHTLCWVLADPLVLVE